jgi:hypothetical protein
MSSFVARNDTFIGGIDSPGVGSADLEPYKTRTMRSTAGGRTSPSTRGSSPPSAAFACRSAYRTSISMALSAPNFYSGTKITVAGPLGLFSGTESVIKDWVTPVGGFAAQYRYDDHWFTNAYEAPASGRRRNLQSLPISAVGAVNSLLNSYNNLSIICLSLAPANPPILKIPAC